MGEALIKQGKKKKLCINGKSWVYHTNDKCYTLEKNKHNGPTWYSNYFNPDGSRKVGNQEWGMGPDQHTGNSVSSSNLTT